MDDFNPNGGQNFNNDKDGGLPPTGGQPQTPPPNGDPYYDQQGQQNGYGQNPPPPPYYQNTQGGTPPPPPPQGGYYQPGQMPPPYQQYPGQNPKSNGLAIASLVLGIASICLSCTVYFSFITGIVGIILGIISVVRQNPGKKMAIAGIICSAVGILLTIFLLVFTVAVIHEMGYDGFTDFLEDYSYYN